MFSKNSQTLHGVLMRLACVIPVKCTITRVCFHFRNVPTGSHYSLTVPDRAIQRLDPLF